VKKKWLLLRAATLVLALVHLFPANKHVGLFFAEPSFGEAWKGFGAVFAVALYLLPPRTQANLLCVAWSRARGLLVALGWLIAAVHLVPALDHVPSFLAAPSWADAWRGFGACIAAGWFALPLEVQARLLSGLRATGARCSSRGPAPARAPYRT
jgi:hypothetical protein